ncbi:MAG: class I SAM-dependent methyltransferase, partial [Pseudomonadota bacterium]|nr:class I SAM-dependent methyltransferase [Pseudomonadota bacterium]
MQQATKAVYGQHSGSAARTSRQFKALPILPVRHPLLEAFGHTERGTLALKTPEGAVFTFEGRQSGPNATLELKDWETLDSIVAEGENGFAHGYMDGRWDTDDLPALLTFSLANVDALERFFYGKPLYALWTRLKCALNLNTVKGSRKNIMAHYDLGNRFYELWLDKSMTYSCALFGDHPEQSLEEAQQNKYRRILDRLSPTPSSRILDIGCGWGAFAEAAARRKLRVHGVTISDEQKLYAEKRLRDGDLDRFAHVELKDYRKVEGTFDGIVSIGMFEHVGEKYWPEYFRTVKARLRAGGKAMIQSITIDDVLFERLHGKYGFVEQYIFP